MRKRESDYTLLSTCKLIIVLRGFLKLTKYSYTKLILTQVVSIKINKKNYDNNEKLIYF